jgi:hypothetical protein
VCHSAYKWSFTTILDYIQASLFGKIAVLRSIDFILTATTIALEIAISHLRVVRLNGKYAQKYAYTWFFSVADLQNGRDCTL